MTDLHETIAELRRLLAEATPGPWPIVYDESFGPGYRAIDVPVNTVADAKLIPALVNAAPALLDAAEELDRLGDRLQTVADEAFGPFETLPADRLVTHIEQGLHAQRVDLTNELDRLRTVEAAARWVPVGERLPEHGTPYLIMHGAAQWMRVAVWRGLTDDDGLWFSVPEDSALSCVTHWMPLPDPPQEPSE